ncbi:retrovirus-related pol polyprotein from transposon TNT 1-94 [Tanacetum coccineum]
MHNNIMAAGSKDRPPMLGPGRYSQWRSRFLRYLDTKSNGEYLRKCIFEGPYTPTSVLIAAVEAAENIPPVAAHEEAETIHNMTTENKLYFQAEKEAIFLILTGIGDEIYSTVDACNTAKEMWTAIERLQQGESLNVQDVKTNLFWEFGKFTSRDGESMESYYSRFYKLMNELTRNNLQVSPMQVNVQFLQQLQPEWSRFVRARSANPLALLAAAQPYSDNYYQAPKPQRSNAPSYMQSSSTRPRYAKELALLAKYFKKLYKPTNNNLRTSSNSRNKTEDTTPSRQSGSATNRLQCFKLARDLDNMPGKAGSQSDTDEEIDEQELEAHYSYMAKIQEVSPEESSSTSQPLEQNVLMSVLRLLTFIANLTLDMKENKTVLKQLKKANASLTQELKECKTNLDETSRALGEATSSQDSCLIALQTKQTELEKSIMNTSDPANRFCPNGEETVTLEKESRSKLDKEKFKLQNSRTSNENVVCAECGTCVFNSNHDACVSRYLKDVNARTKKPNVVPISASKPKRKANKSVATPHKKTVASDTTIQKSKSYYKELYENTNQEWKWWIAKRCPSGYTWTQKPLRTKKIWMPKIRKDDESTSISPTIDIVSRITNIVQLILFIVDSGCTKHMTGNLKLLCNFVEKFLGTVRFGNDQFAPILGYGDLIQGNVTIKRVYYVEGLNHNLFSVGQFCDADLEVAFRKSTCFVRDLQGNDLLTGSRGSDLYTISLQETTSSTPICFMAKASPTQAWLWHRRLSHLNFDYITLLSKKDVVTGLPKLTYVKDQLCSSCEMSKAKRSSFKSKAVPSSKGRLNLLHMDLCGPMRVASINGKKYILVIVDDYSRYTWTLFLRSKDETPEVLKDFLTMIQRNLQAQVITVRTDRGTEFLNKTLHAYFKEEGIEHQTSTPRTPEQNGVVERRNRTLVEAARTMLSASKLPLSFWAEAVATACYTQNRSIIISTHGKTAYHIINDRKPSIKHLHIFGCTCYITRDGENLDKMKEKGDPCVMVGYSTQSKGYRVYNKRTRLIVESIHIKFDEIKEMMSDHNSSDLAPQRQEMSVENVSSGLVPQGQKASDYDNSDPVPPRQNVVPDPRAPKTKCVPCTKPEKVRFVTSRLNFSSVLYPLEEYYNPNTRSSLRTNNNEQAPNASFKKLNLNQFLFCYNSTRNWRECNDIEESFLLSQLLSLEAEEVFSVAQPISSFLILIIQKNLPSKESFVCIAKASSKSRYDEAIKLSPDVQKALTKDHSGCLDTRKSTSGEDTVVRLGINPMIQPEPEDLPKDNPKLEIAVLRIKKKCMDKGSKERSPPHNLRQKPGQYICCQNHKLIADIENDIMDPVMQCTTLPSHSGFSQQKLVSFVTEIHTLSIDISLRDC